MGEQYAAQLIDQLHPEGSSLYSANLGLAIACLSELRRLDFAVPLAERLLDDACKAVERLATAHYDNEDERLRATVAAVEAVGGRWPVKDPFVRWLRRFRGDRSMPAHAGLFGDFVASVGAGSEEARAALLALLEESDDRITALVPHALAKGWPQHEGTIPVLRQLAMRDSEWTAYFALQALGQYFGTVPSCRDVIFDVAIRSGLATARLGAIRAMRFLPPDALTRKALAKAAREELDHQGREAAIVALNRFAQAGDVQEVLTQVACADGYSGCRKLALQVIAENSDGHAIALLQRRATDDESYAVRLFAAEKLRELRA